MTKPIILTVDDEADVLTMINRDLRRHFGKNYRVIRAGSGREALTILTELKQRNDPVAMLISDQRMPEMEGTEFLAEAMKLYPYIRLLKIC